MRIFVTTTKEEKKKKIIIKCSLNRALFYSRVFPFYKSSKQRVVLNINPGVARIAFQSWRRDARERFFFVHKEKCTARAFLTVCFGLNFTFFFFGGTESRAFG